MPEIRRILPRQSLVNIEFELFMGAVEWKGILHVFEYTKELRIVIGRLASIRLNACYKLSRELTTKEFERIYSTTNEVMADNEKVEFCVDAKNEPNFQNSVLALAEHSAFDGSDRFEMIKDYIPPAAVVSIGILGYRSVVNGVLRHTPLSKSGKLLFTGLVIAGNIL